MYGKLDKIGQFKNVNEKYFTYILECSDKSYYIGSTNDLTQRIARHNTGQAAEWTKNRRPVRLVYSEEHPSLTEATRREKQIKHWSRIKKENLIRGIWKKKI